MIDQDVFIPYIAQHIIGEIRSHVRVLTESYDENGTHLKLRASKKYLDKLKIEFNV